MCLYAITLTHICQYLEVFIPVSFRIQYYVGTGIYKYAPIIYRITVPYAYYEILLEKFHIPFETHEKRQNNPEIHDADRYH